MLKQEDLGRFIGRKKELSLFRQWLTSRDPDAPWILYVHDALEDQEKKGGVGKTWLLGQFASLAQELYPDTVVVHVDFFNVADRDGVIVADHVFEALHAAYPTWKANSFAQNLVDYRIAIRKGIEDLYEIRKRMSDALIADLKELDAQLRQEHRHLLVFCDTYEMIEQNPAVAALRSDQSFPDNYEFERMGVVIAGRNALDWTQVNHLQLEAEGLFVTSGLHRNSAYLCRRAALASRSEASGAIDTNPVLAQSCRARSVLMVMFLAPIRSACSV